jgi:hypothetical protein
MQVFECLLYSIIILDILESGHAPIINWTESVLMDIGFLKLWNKEIKEMNRGKAGGAPFEYSHSYIYFLFINCLSRANFRLNLSIGL